MASILEISYGDGEVIDVEDVNAIVGGHVPIELQVVLVGNEQQGNSGCIVMST